MDTPQVNQPFNIILATDGSDHAMAAARLVNDLPLPPNSSITIFAVLVPREASLYSLLDASLKQTRQIFQNKKDVSVAIEMQTGYPAEKITEFAEEHRPNLIVLGAKGLRHTLGILVGGVAQQVVEYTQTPVLVVRAPYTGLKRIMLSIDASECSRHALEFLSGAGGHLPFPLPAEASISVAHVLAPVAVYPRYMPTIHQGQIFVPPEEELESIRAEEKNQGERLLQQAVATLQRAGRQASSVLLDGDAATEMIEYAEKKQIDLIMVGSRGLSPAKAWLLGSVSRKLVHYASCSVLVIK
ncbi:MAG: universal stress protein [Anaerolineales bacterium]|jgi:nucleotide-binding universal stress UspA family protein